MPVIDWAIAQRLSGGSFQPQWADPRVVHRGGRDLGSKLRAALQLYPADLLFVHRDAEAQDPALRLNEIEEAVRTQAESVPPYCVLIPVRMTQAWFLFDDAAMRKAAGNPNGSDPLSLPRVTECDRLSDPKQTLHALLQSASGLSGRRLRRFNPVSAVHLLSREITDYSPLRALPAFKDFEARLDHTLELLRGRVPG